MSNFLNSKFKFLTPYNTGGDSVPENCIRLNTNENPYAPSPKIFESVNKSLNDLNFYGDPECKLLAEKAAEVLNIQPDEILFGNGSDEILNFIFMSMCENGAVFPDITYSFYKVLAQIHGVKFDLIPLKNFKIVPEDYLNLNSRTAFITNPNAPTGIALNLNDIKKILNANPQSLIVVDEAYVDFGGESAIKLIHDFKNLIITRTFSKSRSMAGARLGFAISNSDLINDLRNIKNSLAPYNINSMTQAAGIAVFEDESYTQNNIREIINTRENFTKGLKDLGFEVLNSRTNFVFICHKDFSGDYIFNELLKNKILIRHFKNPESISNYNRITIGTPEQMNLTLEVLKNALRRN